MSHEQVNNNKILITSDDNRKFKELKSLLDSGGKTKRNKIIVSGKKIIKEILKENKLKAAEIITFENWFDNDQDFIKLIEEFSKNSQLVILKKSLFNELDEVNTRQPLLVIEAPVTPIWNPKYNRGCTLVLAFQNPVNIGACIRSAAAFGVGRIVVLKDAANPFHPRSIRASAGTVFKCRIFRGPAIEDLLKHNRDLTNLITLDMKGHDLGSFSFPADFILLPGIEGPGLIKKIKHLSLSIRMEDGVESLNAGVSVSIALYEWKKRLNNSGYKNGK